jgi:hypothetical protein
MKTLSARITLAPLLIIVALLASGAASATPPGQDGIARRAGPPLSIVSEDPYTNPRSFHRTEVEPDTFAFGSTIVSTFQAGKFPDLGASNLGWSVSTDAGATWAEGFLPGTTGRADPPGPWQRVTDPAVTYDAKHGVWLIFGLESPLHDWVFVSRSTDGAQTFGDPVVVRHSEADFDKNWINCDNYPASPYYGTCHTAWTDWNNDGRLLASTSSDGGLTWTRSAVRKGTGGFYVQPLVQPDGAVITPALQCCPLRIDSFISTDGGLTFRGHRPDYSGPLALHGVRVSKVHGKLRMGVAPISADVDADGNIYVVWQDCRFRHTYDKECTQNDIVMSTTTDGRHWSPVVRVPIDPRTSPVDHFIPSIAVDPTTSGSSAHIAIVYYFYPEADCRVATCELSVGFTSSTDGGTTWTDQQLAGPFKNRWLPLTDSGYMVGDYIGVSFVDGSAVPVFAVAAKGACELGNVTSCNEWTASATIPLSP